MDTRWALQHQRTDEDGTVWQENYVYIDTILCSQNSTLSPNDTDAFAISPGTIADVDYYYDLTSASGNLSSVTVISASDIPSIFSLSTVESGGGTEVD